MLLQLLIVTGIVGIAGQSIHTVFFSSAKVKADPAEREYKRASKSMDRITREQMMELLRKGRELGQIDNLPEDPKELESLADLLARQTVSTESPRFGSATGSQSLVLRSAIANTGRRTVEVLPLSFDGPEWSAVFERVLGTSYLDEDLEINEWRRRQKAYFRESLPNYPMLARIWDTYIDVEYKPEEIVALKNECLSVQTKTQDPTALKGLSKLVTACDKALEKGMGLSLLAD